MLIKYCLISVFCIIFMNTYTFAKDIKKIEPSYKLMCEQNLHTAKQMRSSPLMSSFSYNPEYKNQLHLADKYISQAQEGFYKKHYEACYYQTVSAILLMKSLSNLQRAKKYENPSTGR